MNEAPLKFTFKITVIGDGGVGKTSLIQKYTQDTFQKEYISTIGAQFSIYNEKLNEDDCKLILWDVAGQNEFRLLRSSFYEGSRAAIIVYSLEENKLGKDSYKHVTDWYEDIKKYCGEIPVVLFANKVDLVNENKLDGTEIQNLLKGRDIIGVYHTSAKTGVRVKEAFQVIVKELYNKLKRELESLK